MGGRSADATSDRRFTLAQFGVPFVTVALFAWFLWRPELHLLAALLLLGLPWLWRWQRLSLVWLLVAELAVVAFIVTITVTCAFDACARMRDANDPWHFLHDMALSIVAVGSAGVLLAGLPGLVRWLKQSRVVHALPWGWRRQALWALPVLTAAFGLLPVFFLTSIFAPLGLVERKFVVVLVALGVPSVLSALVGFALRTWVPSLLGILAVGIRNIGAKEACERALECHFTHMDPLAYPSIHLLIGAVLVGAALVGRTVRRRREDRRAEEKSRADPL